MNKAEVVLSRDRHGRPVLWRCSDCGEPFNLGWGTRCNKCITSDERHKEIIAAIERLLEKILEELGKAEAAIERYGEHRVTCTYEYGECDCGLSEFVKEQP